MGDSPTSQRTARYSTHCMSGFDTSSRISGSNGSGVPSDPHSVSPAGRSGSPCKNHHNDKRPGLRCGHNGGLPPSGIGPASGDPKRSMALGTSLRLGCLRFTGHPLCNRKPECPRVEFNRSKITVSRARMVQCFDIRVDIPGRPGGLHVTHVTRRVLPVGRSAGLLRV